MNLSATKGWREILASAGGFMRSSRRGARASSSDSGEVARCRQPIHKLSCQPQNHVAESLDFFRHRFGHFDAIGMTYDGMRFNFVFKFTYVSDHRTKCKWSYNRGVTVVAYSPLRNASHICFFLKQTNKRRTSIFKTCFSTLKLEPKLLNLSTIEN